MTIQLLSATFSLPLRSTEISRWRGAWAEMAGLRHDVFHNHKPGQDNYHYRYPLVQYRSRQRKAGILAVNEANEAVRNALIDQNWTIQWNGEPTRLDLERMHLETYELHMPQRELHYYLRGYLPFNDDNYRQYVEADNLALRVALLERLLANHLLSCCRGLGYQLPRRLDVTLTHLLRSYRATVHKLERPLFDLRFRANLFLPSGIGVGKGISQGCGVLSHDNPPT